MGADCCGSTKTLLRSEDARDSCDKSSMTKYNEKIECCTPNNEQCNAECLKSVAATLCAEEAGSHSDGHCGTINCSDGPQTTSACDAHLQMAFSQYQSFLDNARCICRNMIERGFKSCCKMSDSEIEARQPNAAPLGSSGCETGRDDSCRLSDESTAGGKKDCCSVDRARGQRQLTVGSTGQCEYGNCCDRNHEFDHDRGDKEPLEDYCGSSKKRPDNCCGSKTKSKDVCVKKEPSNCCITKQKSGGACGSKKRSNCSSDDSLPADCRDEWCGGKAKRNMDPCCTMEKQGQLAKQQVTNGNQAIDTEKGGGKVVRISVTGMTCNGCSENLTRNLAANGLSNIRVNYLQGYADFSIDPALNLDAILANTREATGFQMTKMGGDESLTVLTSGSQTSTALAQIDLDGVEDVMILNKRTVRIQYNPTVIGARDLFHNIGDLAVGLAPPENDQQLASGRKRFITLLAQTITSFTLAIPILVLAWGETHVEQDTKAIISLVLGSLVQFLAIPVFYKPALQSLIRYGVFELDMLVVVGITAAYLYSIVAFGYFMAGAPLETGSFFETSALLISLIMLGRLVASYARIRAVAAVSVRSLQASKAVLVEGGKDQEIDSRLLQFGDIFKVTPHNRVPTDGTVISGVSEVDESMVTGESLPIAKVPGTSLVAGTINGSGTLVVELTRVPGKNTITDIAKLVEDASSSKPRVQEAADRVASWFLPTVLTIAIAVFITWTVVGLKVRNQTGGESVATAITYAVAVLAVSCPCGLGLAVPIVLVVTNGIAARGGVIVKSAQCTERSRKVTDVVFDKTGTLTEPDLDVVAEEFFDSDPVNARAITKALINDSQHPVSVALAKHLGPGIQSSPLVTDIQSIPGAGIEGSMSGLVVRAGHAHWTGSETLPEVCNMLDGGMSVLLVTRESTPIAGYGLQARLRGDAVATVAKLREDGIEVHLVSGDQNKAVQAVAAAVGIDRANVASQRKPEEKQAYVATLMAQPSKVVMFCGDGTNDAVAVAQADIGVQLSDAISSEVTRSAADVVLLSGLKGIPFLIEVSRASFKRVAFNFIWSAIYNVFAILLAAGAFVRIRIAPAYAGAGELVSILPVIIAALTMLLLKLRPS